MAVNRYQGGLVREARASEPDPPETVHRAEPVYWWCAVCDQPITDIQTSQTFPLGGSGALAELVKNVLPCGHKTGDAAPLYFAGIVTTVGEGVGPLPSIHIAGRS